MRLSSGYEGRKARIEMVPLIDTIFLLLVFFIYGMLSMVVHRGLKVELPEASTPQVDKREYISITITKDNMIYLDKEQITLDELVSRIAGRMKGKKDIPVFIEGDKYADLGVAIRILDLLRGVGIREISFAAMEETR